MKSALFKSITLYAVIAVPTIMSVGCSHEVAHTETDKPGWFGGSTHEEKTVYKNADGTYSTEQQKTHTDN